MCSMPGVHSKDSPSLLFLPGMAFCATVFQRWLKILLPASYPLKKIALRLKICFPPNVQPNSQMTKWPNSQMAMTFGQPMKAARREREPCLNFRVCFVQTNPAPLFSASSMLMKCVLSNSAFLSSGFWFHPPSLRADPQRWCWAGGCRTPPQWSPSSQALHIWTLLLLSYVPLVFNLCLVDLFFVPKAFGGECARPSKQGWQPLAVLPLEDHLSCIV